MDEFHAHKVSISTSIFKYLLTWFFNEFKRYIYMIRLIVFESRDF